MRIELLLNKNFISIRLAAILSLLALGTLCTSFASAQTRFPDAFWQQVQISPPPDNVPDYWLEVYFLPSNPQLGWVVGFYRRVLFTTDGGKTWTRSQIPGRISYDRGDARNHLEGIWFPDPQVGYASGPGGVFKSSDGGRTWRDITPRQLAGIETRLWGSFFSQRDSGIVTGGGCGAGIRGTSDAQYVFRTTDGGNSWSFFAGNEPNTGMTDAYLYSSRGLGYASSSGLIWRTLNGGIAWSIFAPTATPTSIASNVWQEDLAISNNSFLVPLSGTQCNGGGNTGGVRFSRDGCKTWSEYNSGTVMYGAYLLNDSTGWACGDDATVIQTRDYGQTWNLVNCGIPSNVNIDDIWFVNDTTGFAVGEGVFRFVPPAKRELKIEQFPVRTLLCQGDSVELRVSDGFTNYSWSNGASTATIVVKESGNYRVRVSVPTCVDGIDSVQISFLPRPDARIALSGPARVCAGETVRMTTAVVQSGFTYQWTEGRTVLSSTPTLDVTRSGTYSLTVRGMSGCIASSTQTITVFPRPNTTITSLRQTRFCIGDSAVLQAPAGFVQVRWSDGVKSDIARGQTLITRSSGNYSAELVDNNGCTWTSNTITLRALSFAKQLFVVSTQTEFRLDTTGLNRLTCASITLFNADSVRSVVMQNIPLLRNIEFSLPPSLLPFVLPPGTRRTLIVCFSPRDVGARRDTMFVEDSCGVTPIALVGEGMSNNYAGTSRCNARLILRSIGENGLASSGGFSAARLAVVRLAQPSPNPASNGVSLLVERLLEPQTGIALDARCFVKDLLGNTLAEAEYSSLERFSETSAKESFEFERGTFSVNTSHLPSGAYLLVVQTSQGATAFPIIVQR
jgi:photosystem II stability/assembly factor-like uncharacterized protein